MAIDPPYRLDPFQNIVNVKWLTPQFSVGFHTHFFWRGGPIPPEYPPHPNNPHVRIYSGTIPSGWTKNWPDFPQDDSFGAVYEDWYRSPIKTDWTPVWDTTPQKVGLNVTLLLKALNGGTKWERTFDCSTWTIETGTATLVADYCWLPATNLYDFYDEASNGPTWAGTGFQVIFKVQEA